MSILSDIDKLIDINRPLIVEHINKLGLEEFLAQKNVRQIVQYVVRTHVRAELFLEVMDVFYRGYQPTYFLCELVAQRLMLANMRTLREPHLIAPRLNLDPLSIKFNVVVETHVFDQPHRAALLMTFVKETPLSIALFAAQPDQLHRLELPTVCSRLTQRFELNFDPAVLEQFLGEPRRHRYTAGGRQSLLVEGTPGSEARPPFVDRPLHSLRFLLTRIETGTVPRRTPVEVIEDSADAHQQHKQAAVPKLNLGGVRSSFFMGTGGRETDPDVAQPTMRRR